jgi:group I intron endonuclease
MRKNNSNISGIYKITNIINNKFYIGSTYCFLARKNHHFNRLFHNKHPNKYLQMSYNKYGINNFKFEIIAKCPKEYNLKLEQWFIDNMKPNYNLQKTAGSNLGIKFSEEHKVKIGLKNKNKIRSKEFKNRLSIIGKQNINIEHIKILVNKAKEVNCKIVLQYNKNMILLSEYNSLTEAALAINGDVSTITKVCKGKLNSHKNFIFKYK